mmetsp:Transcript_18120/g.22842  ORF Transcript_18120/g.22842 Transcript_18120/m.22842 type:complete len:413 (+) Transcript_18120:108-1346(+)
MARSQHRKKKSGLEILEEKKQQNEAQSDFLRLILSEWKGLCSEKSEKKRRLQMQLKREAAKVRRAERAAFIRIMKQVTFDTWVRKAKKWKNMRLQGKNIDDMDESRFDNIGLASVALVLKKHLSKAITDNDPLLAAKRRSFFGREVGEISLLSSVAEAQAKVSQRRARIQKLVAPEIEPKTPQSSLPSVSNNNRNISPSGEARMRSPSYRATQQSALSLALTQSPHALHSEKAALSTDGSKESSVRQPTPPSKDMRRVRTYPRMNARNKIFKPQTRPKVPHTLNSVKELSPRDQKDVTIPFRPVMSQKPQTSGKQPQDPFATSKGRKQHMKRYNKLRGIYFKEKQSKQLSKLEASLRRDPKKLNKMVSNNILLPTMHVNEIKQVQETQLERQKRLENSISEKAEYYKALFVY